MKEDDVNEQKNKIYNNHIISNLNNSSNNNIYNSKKSNPRSKSRNK